MLLSNTLPGGTLGRLIASDRSTVAQPDIGFSPQVTDVRAASIPEFEHEPRSEGRLSATTLIVFLTVADFGK